MTSEHPMSPEEWEAVDRDEAGIYFLSADEVRNWEETGALPVHSDNDVVVVNHLFLLAGRMCVRWFKRREEP